MKFYLGTCDKLDADFFVLARPHCVLGSLTLNNMRRVYSTATDALLEEDKKEFTNINSSSTVLVSEQPAEPKTGLGTLVKNALTMVGITEEAVTSWLGAPCGCAEREEKLNRLGRWAADIAKGIASKMPFAADSKPIPAVCGAVHDGTMNQFLSYMKSLGVSGIEIGEAPPHTYARRIVSHNPLYHALIRNEIFKWNDGSEIPKYQTPWVPNRVTSIVTTCPARLSTLLPETIRAVRAAGFDPDIYADGLLSQEQKAGIQVLLSEQAKVHDGHNVQPFSHWYRSVLTMFMQHPWSQWYVVFQDDLTCPKTLLQYILNSKLPPKAYFNLFTFMENEQVAAESSTGWIEAYKTKKGVQFGRGGVCLMFRHDALTALLSQQHMLMRRLNYKRGNTSLDGAIVEAMTQAGYREYIHNPSLVQHTGHVSSMGNKQHEQAKTYPGDDFDLMTLLKDTPHVNTPADNR
jgi:hypothetical protein